MIMKVYSNKKEKTFKENIGVNGGHTCCQSKAPWRHKDTCKNNPRNYKDDLSDLKDI